MTCAQVCALVERGCFRANVYICVSVPACALMFAHVFYAEKGLLSTTHVACCTVTLYSARILIGLSYYYNIISSNIVTLTVWIHFLFTQFQFRIRRRLDEHVSAAHVSEMTACETSEPARHDGTHVIRSLGKVDGSRLGRVNISHSHCDVLCRDTCTHRN